MTGTTDARPPLTRLVERRHPEHKRHCGEWCFLREAIEMLPGEYAEKHLFKHPKEDASVFANRKARAADHRHNLTREVLETYLGYLFQSPPTKAEGLPEAAVEFLEKADLDGRPAIELAKDIAFWGAAFGVVWICVDMPATSPAVVAAGPEGEAEERPMSRRQEREAGLAPYAYVVHPTHVLDGRMVNGRPEWLLVKEDDRDDADPMTSSGEVLERWRLWLPTEWVLIEKIKPTEGQAVTEIYRIADRKAHNAGCVPFVGHRFGRGSGFASPGLVAEIAHIDRAIFNKTSLVDEIHYAVTFPQLGYPYSGNLYEEGVDASGNKTGGLTPEGKAILTVGLHSVIPYNAESGAPAYITPPSEPAIEIRQSIREMAKVALALALLDGEIGIEAGEDGPAQGAESGVAKSYVFEKLNRKLAEIADGLQATFRKILELVCRWMGIDPDAETGGLPGVPWDFPDSFEVRSLAQELLDLTTILASTPPSSTLVAELWKRVAKKALPKADEETMETISAEIDAGAIVNFQGAAGAMADIDNYQNRAGAGEADELEEPGEGKPPAAPEPPVPPAGKGKRPAAGARGKAKPKPKAKPAA